MNEQIRKLHASIEEVAGIPVGMKFLIDGVTIRVNQKENDLLIEMYAEELAEIDAEEDEKRVTELNQELYEKMKETVRQLRNL